MTQIKSYKTKDNLTRYFFNVYVGRNPKTGKNVYRKRQGFKTKKQAQIALADLLKDIEENGLFNENKVMTFKDLYDMWLKQHRLNVKPSTIATNRRFVEGHVLPHLGDMKLDDITVIYCQKLVNEWYEEYKQYPYFRKVTAQIMRYGEAMEIMKSNPMAKTILPRKKEEENKLQYYTKEELQHFFECLDQYGNYKQLAFFRTLAFTGCRKSEILSLQWEDIDLFNKTVSIGKTLAIDENLDIIIQTPKTSSSVREISLDDETIKILSRWRSIQREEYFQMGFNTTSDKQFVFTNVRNELYYPQIVNDWLKYLIKKYKLPKITPHNFRHTHASLLLQAGIPVKEVSERLGHKDIKITLEIYSHVMPEEAEKTANKFANFVGF
ncbi:site-specific integrase [Vagococcus carniphilus]|uniref:site-specific integrase n=1 Tax=Vagococcus carniphilus TaxID=218144 RepID=UPI00288EC72F|nr:site-specific integrase [Vagococcus carniphilus]MDT2831873.1 site-specific integrase [Vagococcus carniphilus]MDT2855383.1 site-specific integrase [Vagococcus carniphilus]